MGSNKNGKKLLKKSVNADLKIDENSGKLLVDYAYKDSGTDEESKTHFSDCIDKLIKSNSFRKLAGKTQVILSLSGADVRTRLTHTMEVAQIARNLSRELGLNEELAEAIALAHDVGHTPFGHVGERTLKEIMCGCDKLDGRNLARREHWFDFSGFKHNLQGVRVLKKDVGNDDSKDWKPILWGVADHSKMSYSKMRSKFENEILISSKHCKKVHMCDHCDHNKCRHNSMASLFEDHSVPCSPWYCAYLLQKENDEWIKAKVRCNGGQGIDAECSKPGPCYLAQLWKYKIDNNPSGSQQFSFLFDHPFPNSFYSQEMEKYFLHDESERWVSAEAVVVGWADEIAQREHDLEDGITKNLISITDAKDEMHNLICKTESNEFLSKILSFNSNCKDHLRAKSKLGEIVRGYYSDILIKSIKKNLSLVKRTSNIHLINILYIANKINYILKINPYYDKFQCWICDEIDSINDVNKNGIDKICNELTRKLSIPVHYDQVNHRGFLCCIAYDFIKQCHLRGQFDNDIIIKKLSDSNIFNIDLVTKKENACAIMDAIKNELYNIYPECSKAFYRRESDVKWFESKDLDYKSVVRVGLLRGSLTGCTMSQLVGGELPVIDEKDVNFSEWVKFLGYESQLALKNIINIKIANHPERTSDENESAKKHEAAIDCFECKQKSLILNSEIVEKNDGKASYMIRKLFKAYISDIHQLPDEGLKVIYEATQEHCEDLYNDFRDHAKNIYENTHSVVELNRDREKIKDDPLLFLQDYKDIMKPKYETLENNIESFLIKHYCAHELKDILNDTKDFVLFLVEHCVNSAAISQNEDINELKKFRKIVDNPILNATPYWQKLVLRGVCDYIASLTDQEAINEYEKLYNGIMVMA